MCHKANMVTHLLAILQKVSFGISKKYAKNRQIKVSYWTLIFKKVEQFTVNGKYDTYILRKG